jgi:hypothetical protein
MEEFDDHRLVLRSVTIFWTQLGMVKNTDLSRHDKLAVWWDEEVQPWINVAIKGHYNPHTDGVWFAEPRDAALFLTRWNGQLP